MSTARRLAPIPIVLGLALTAPAAAAGTLGDNQILHSDVLGYALQYRVYTPRGAEDTAPAPSTAEGFPVLYVVDGQWYIEPGRLPRLLDELIGKGAIEPIIAVFVDNRDPGNLGDNRRNRQFFCNRDYATFFATELIPAIDEAYPSRPEWAARTILGLSFGGLNAACFGLFARESFSGIAMQSPALHPIPAIHQAWSDAPAADLRIFLSTGTQNDNEASTRRLRDILREKEYDLHYVEVDEGHDWQNWGPLLDDVLLYFYGHE